MVAIDLTAESGQREALRVMLRIRRFEERAGELFADNEIPGFVHLYIGQEAVATGATGALTGDDYITSTHRGHGHCVAMDLELDRLFAELMGRHGGTNEGKGGSMHMADVERGMLGANGIVGSGAPLATGAGLTKKVTGEDGVGLAFYGDGGVSQGQVHESINMAAAMDLPAIYVVEKNQYVEMMDDEDVFGNPNFADFGTGYGIPGVAVDGMDVEAVYEAVSEARARAVAGEGPTLVVAETYRFREHAEGTPHPRSDEEVDGWRDRDPIARYRDRLVERGTLDESTFESMDAEVQSAVDEAVEAARESPMPEPDDAYDGLFVEPAPDVDYHRARLDGSAWLETDGDGTVDTGVDPRPGGE
jgi:pyruvate dehydrogenase E1 component alpha subunit